MTALEKANHNIAELVGIIAAKEYEYTTSQSYCPYIMRGLERNCEEKEIECGQCRLDYTEERAKELMQKYEVKEDV